MRKLILICASVLSLTACTSTEKAATVGGVAGALIGGTTSGSVVGAAVGGAIGATAGAVAGELLGRYDRDPNRCVFVNRRTGERYLDTCPRG